MALIPSKDKVKNFSTDSLDFTTMMILLAVVIVGSHFISEFVHERFEIMAIILLLLIVVYLLFPSRLNYGKNGVQRITILLKFYFKKIRRKIIR